MCIWGILKVATAVVCSKLDTYHLTRSIQLAITCFLIPNNLSICKICTMFMFEGAHTEVVCQWLQERGEVFNQF